MNHTDWIIPLLTFLIGLAAGVAGMMIVVFRLHNQVRDWIDGLRIGLEGKMTAIDSKISSNNTRIHQRIDEVWEQVGANEREIAVLQRS